MGEKEGGRATVCFVKGKGRSLGEGGDSLEDVKGKGNVIRLGWGYRVRNENIKKKIIYLN